MSGNYQSRVFTFISKRTDRLKDTCAKGLRHIKVAVVWTSQILLYPLQLLAQKIGDFQPQLAPPPPQRSLPQPTADINIEQALDLVVSSGYPILFQRDSANEIATAADLIIVERSSSRELHSIRPSMVGISVADDDRITETEEWEWEIEARTPQSRQATLNKPIVRGLSSLLSDRQLVLVTTENQLLDILTLAQQQEIRRRIGMDLAITWERWYQHSLGTDSIDRQLSPAEKVSFIDRTEFAQIEGKHQHLPQLSSVGPDVRSPKLIERLHDWWQNLTTKSPISTQQSLELANESSAELSQQLLPNSYSFTPQPPQISRWLDLPQLPPFIENPPAPPHDRPVLETLAKLQPDWLKQWWHYYREYLYIPAKDDLQIIQQPTEFRLTPVVSPIDLDRQTSLKTKFRAVAKPQNIIDRGAGKLSKPNYQNIEYQPDWIEAESETIGYNVSLIAKILGWLDRLMLSIENWLIKIWHLITSRAIKD
jgi:hypothetical protein